MDFHLCCINTLLYYIYYSILLILLYINIINVYLWSIPHPVLCDKPALPLWVYQATACLSSATPRVCAITPPGRLAQTFV